MKDTAEVQRDTEISKHTSITAYKGFWRVSGINYRNSCYTFDVKRGLLPEGTQSELAKRCMEGEFNACDLPAHYALFRTLFKASMMKDCRETALEARAFMGQQLKKTLMTLSRVRHHGLTINDKRMDLFIHGYNTDKIYYRVENITKDEKIWKSKNSILYRSLLCTLDEPRKINTILAWVSNHRYSHVSSLPSKPTFEYAQTFSSERIVTLDAQFFGGLTIDLCDGSINMSGRALGMRCKNNWR